VQWGCNALGVRSEGPTARGQEACSGMCGARGHPVLWRCGALKDVEGGAQCVGGKRGAAGVLRWHFCAVGMRRPGGAATFLRGGC